MMKLPVNKKRFSRFAGAIYDLVDELIKKDKIPSEDAVLLLVTCSMELALQAGLTPKGLSSLAKTIGKIERLEG